MPWVIVQIVCVCMCTRGCIKLNVCLWFAAMRASKEKPQVYITAEPPHLAQWRFISVVKTHVPHTRIHTQPHIYKVLVFLRKKFDFKLINEFCVR